MHAACRPWAIAFAALAGAVTADAARQPERSRWPWNRPEAEVTATGDLRWKPDPFRFEAGPSVRYIDFDAGDDSRDGTSTATAWKHHPWDPAAGGQARASTGIRTFVFKRGVTYRGTLLAGRAAGTAAQPVRLTSDPAWGAGEAAISGAERVRGWQPGGLPSMPEAGRVWHADLPFAPRCAWQVAGTGTITRLALARSPNWSVSDPNDVMSQWWQWQQPQWWTGRHKAKGRDGKPMHLGLDTAHLTGPADAYVGGIVWSEWGIVMGTPFPSRIETYDAAQKGIGFQGFWGGDSGQIIKGNRYFIEDKPGFLDSPGEFWFDRHGEGGPGAPKPTGEGGTLYVRLPGDADPSTVDVEAARHLNLIDAEALRHVRISGLTFRFNNVFWDLTARPFVHRDVQAAAIRLLGTGEDVRIDHCRFEHVSQAIRLKAAADTDALDGVIVSDNDIAFTDHGAIELAGSERWAKKDPPFARFGDARVLRNRLSMIGLRAFRSDSSHAVVVSFPETLEVAGNILDRCYGAGLFLFMGKGSEETRDAPLSRNLVHHNKVTSSLLAANDWGGIETWQGGPHYVYDNISGNARGYWNWGYSPTKPASTGPGYAYYLDGSFKNYHFNNVAWGLESDPASPHCSNSAFYEAVPTVFNTFFNNTAYRFAHGSGWSPAGGRHLWLGNLWLDISLAPFEHNKQKEDKEASYQAFPFETMGYGRNVFWKTPDVPGHIEGTGTNATTFAGFQALATRQHMLADDIGVQTTSAPVRDAAAHDFRPAAGSPAIDRGAKVFVPWSLARTVGEWHFRRNQADPTIALDDHWYLSAAVVNRDTYYKLPRYDLKGVQLDASAYVDGPLENWTAGAVRLNGKEQVLALPAPEGGLPSPLDMDGSYLVEVYFRTTPGLVGGTLASRMGVDGACLEIDSAGTAAFGVKAGLEARATTSQKVNDGTWHHLVAEFDRPAAKLRLYLDGEKSAEIAAAGVGVPASGAAFKVGQGFAGEIDFLRVALATLAESKTSIEELYDWEFDGPFLRDFAGRAASGSGRDAGAFEGVAP